MPYLNNTKIQRRQNIDDLRTEWLNEQKRFRDSRLAINKENR